MPSGSRNRGEQNIVVLAKYYPVANHCGSVVRKSHDPFLLWFGGSPEDLHFVHWTGNRYAEQQRFPVGHDKLLAA